MPSQLCLLCCVSSKLTTLESRDVELKEWEGDPVGVLFSSSDSSSLLRDLSLSISLQGLYQSFKHGKADDTHEFAAGSVLAASFNRVLLHGLPLL